MAFTLPGSFAHGGGVPSDILVIATGALTFSP